MNNSSKFQSKMKYLCLGWLLDYECPGGDCGLTCCSSEWKILLTDEEIEMYNNSTHPFMNTFRKFIDYENSKMKCTNGKCDALDSNGYCSLVINCGPELLSKTCQTFPRRIKIFGDITELWVEISCPVVAKNLLTNAIIDFSLTDSNEDVICERKVLEMYDQLSPIRLKLIELFQSFPSQFTTGKLFITIQQLIKIQSLIKNNNFSVTTTAPLLFNLNDDSIKKTLIECEQLNNNIDLKVEIIYTVIRSILSDDLLLDNFNNVFFVKPYLSKHLNNWINDMDQFKADLIPYTNYVKAKYPLLTENYYIYVLFTSWIVDNADDFGNEFYSRAIELLIIQLCGMALWKETGELTQDEFSILIAAVDRRTEHVKNQFEKIKTNLQSINIDKDILLTMITI